MINYLEIRNKVGNENSGQLLGIIDTAKSIIWNTEYYGIGDFEIYIEATDNNIDLLQIGNLVTRKDDIHCGIIETIEISDNPQDGRMIVARGRFAKSILTRRLIYKWESTYFLEPTIVTGNVAEAVWKLINENCVSNSNTNRNFEKFTRGTINYLPKTIVNDENAADQKQVTYANLQEYTDELLKEYGYGSYVWLDTTGEFLYVMYEGVDRSVDNKSVVPLIFSTEFDNLTSTNYVLDKSTYKNMAIIGGEELTIQEKTDTQAEIKKRFVTRYGDRISGYDRYEVFVDANGVKKTEKNDAGEDVTILDDVYDKLLIQNGRQQLQKMNIVETFEGELDLTNSGLTYGDDYSLGDIITLQDKKLKKYINTRILTVTEVQDDDGYKINIKYGN